METLDLIMSSSSSAPLELQARGQRIQMPSAQCSSASRSPEDLSSRLFSVENPSRSHHQQPRPHDLALSSRPQTHLLSSHLEELSRTLVFSDDAVTEISPSAVDYASAKQSTNKLFQRGDISIGLPLIATKPIGRHNARGPGFRHLPCHLIKDKGRLFKTKEKCLKDAERSSSHEKSSTIASCTFTEYSTIKHNLPLVSRSTSIPWTDRLLGAVTRDTARHLLNESSRLSRCATTSSLPHCKTDPHTTISASSCQAPLSTTSPTAPITPSSLQFYPSHPQTDELSLFQFSPIPSQFGPAPPPSTFLREVEAGAKPVHLKDRDSIILLDNNEIFRKVVQSCYPQPPKKYCSVAGAEDSTSEGNRHLQAYKKWLDFPQLIKPSEELKWECQGVILSAEDSESEMGLLSQQSSDLSHSVQPEFQEFFDIMHEWMEQWHLHIRTKEIEDDESLVKDMANLSNNTKMLAIAAVAILIENESRSCLEPVSRTTSKYVVPSSTRRVSEELLEELERLLDDDAVHVRVPSAITLYARGMQSKKAKDALLSSLEEETQTVERWAAVQCLACAGVHSAIIISELLTHLKTSYSPLRQAKAAQLLSTISSKTNLVYSMLADLLNNSGCQERLAACNILPLLQGTISKDMCSKLVVLVWEDWNPEIRDAAAKALGKTAHGKFIHDEINKRLTNPSEMVRLDAIRKLYSLEIMTPSLLSNYLTCFKDDHTSIVMTAIAIAGTLRLKQPLVFRALKQLLDNPSWKIKAAALSALADVGMCDDELVEQLMWAVRFEKVPAVRAEVCQTIVELGLTEERVLRTLRDLVTVEEDPLVVREVACTLIRLGYTGRVTDQMLQHVCESVKKLGTKEKIISQVVALDTSSTVDYVLGRSSQKLTCRDYLDDTQRARTYSSCTSSDLSSRRRKRHSNFSSTEERSDTATETVSWGSSKSPPKEESWTQTSVGKKTTFSVEFMKRDQPHAEWTPDRKTINTHLRRIRTKIYGEFPIS